MIQRPNVVDSCFLRYEQEHPSFRPYSGLIMHAVGPAPAVHRVREQVADRVGRMPTLAWRVSKRGRRTVWEADPHFRPHDHVHEVRLAEGTTPEEAVDDLLCLPMPEQSPRWGIWLIHGYSDREYVLFYRSHHAGQDGQAMMDTLTTLFGTRTSIAPLAAAGAPAARQPWWQRIPARAIAQNLKDQVEALRPTLSWSPQRPLTGKARVQSAAVPMAWLRETGQAMGATSNDICLAALSHAMRQWLPENWIASGRNGRDLHVCLPVSLREPEERFMVGNRLSACRIPLSFWEDSTPARVTAISRATAPARTEETRRVLRGQLRLPEWLVYRFLRQSTQARNGLDTTGLVRLPERLAVGADPIETVVVTQFLHGEHALGVAFLAYGDEVVASVTADCALDEAGDLATLWASAVEHMWHQAAADSRKSMQVPTTST
ncbi:wax ester/triacylglycerol synthase domain-containing protein [Streptomyces sp. NBC_00878]|uniref:wax ester/triacylglycerol synthase domain-containing protein n=1 Tax=Streptomyces sp. NBC_00878 TaxID=2975854 RepID=UPI00224E7572|nr:wax ester/triacylglycerol synthase domain-containing protein [Streptomyces sp. NBC_00878]MCX4907712.1 wax ester/triacylglycerol synthase family O-acyltransferase [Streptomyces sp. NBC_00878]